MIRTQNVVIGGQQYTMAHGMQEFVRLQKLCGCSLTGQDGKMTHWLSKLTDIADDTRFFEVLRVLVERSHPGTTAEYLESQMAFEELPPLIEALSGLVGDDPLAKRIDSVPSAESVSA